MIKETLVRDKTTNIPEKIIEDGKNIDISTFIEEIKEIYRKSEKTKAVLHLAGDIQVGTTHTKYLQKQECTSFYIIVRYSVEPQRHRY